MSTKAYLFIVLFGTAACSSDTKQTSPPQQPPAAVDVMVVAAIELPDRIECNGSILASESVELHVEASGLLTSIYRKDGEAVRAGTLLAKVNDAELQAQLRQQTLQLELARKQKGRLEQLMAVNGVNQADYDDATSKVAVLEAGIEVLRAQIAKTEVRAPFDGVLGLRMVSQGAYVTPQTPLGSLQERGVVRIDFSLPEQYRTSVRQGMSLTVISATDTALAELSAIDPLVNSTTRNLRCRARLKSGELLPGSFVKVLVPRKSVCIAVPSQCIIPDAVSDKVITVHDGKGDFTEVRTGARTRGLVEITAGLSDGDTVIVTGVLFVRPKSPVKIRSVKTLDVPADE